MSRGWARDSRTSISGALKVEDDDLVPATRRYSRQREMLPSAVIVEFIRESSQREKISLR